MDNHFKKRLRTEHEERLRRVVISRITKLREAPNLDIDDEELDASQDQPVAEPKAAPAKPAPTPTAEPEVAAEPAEAPPVADRGGEEMPEEDPIPDADPATDGDDQSKIRQAKVRLFFDKLEDNPTLMNYLTFHSPLEQAEAILRFAEMVKVPRSQLIPLMKTMRTMSQEPQTAPTQESIRRSKVIKSLREYIDSKKKFR